MEEINIDVLEDMNGFEYLSINSGKFKQSFVVRKSDTDRRYYQVYTTHGTCPIHGMFTDLRMAKDEVVNYIRKSKPSKAVKRDEMTARREASRAKRKQKTAGSEPFEGAGQ